MSPEVEAKCEINIQFLTFFCTKIYDLMGTKAERGQYRLQTRN